MYIIVAALVVVIIVAGAAAYVLSNNANNGTTNPTPTPTTNPTVNIPNATSLVFSVNDTSQGTTTTYQFKAANMGTADIALRVDVPGCNAGANFTYVFKAATQSAWNSTNSGAFVTDKFASAWPLWGNMWSGYVTKLDSWNSTATYSYTASNGDAIKIFDISVNPTIPSSTFQTS